jgi:hypothetical protein
MDLAAPLQEGPCAENKSKCKTGNRLCSRCFTENFHHCTKYVYGDNSNPTNHRQILQFNMPEHVAIVVQPIPGSSDDLLSINVNYTTFQFVLNSHTATATSYCVWAAEPLTATRLLLRNKKFLCLDSHVAGRHSA